MNRSKQISEGAILLAIYVGLLLIALFIPLLIVVTPIPFILYTAQHGYRPALIMFVATLLLSALLVMPVSLPLTVISGIGGIMLGETLFKKRSPYETLIQGMIGFVIGLVLSFLLIQVILQVNLYGMLDEMIVEVVGNVEAFMTKYLPGDSIADVESQLSQIKEQMQRALDLIPVAIAVMALLIAFISQWISYKLMNRIFKQTLFFPPFRFFNLPRMIIWFYIPVLILMIAGINETSHLYLFVMNAHFLFMILMIIQGFSFIFFYAHIKKWSVAVPIIVTVVMFIIPLFMFFVIIIGIIDLGVSLKRIIAFNEQK